MACPAEHRRLVGAPYGEFDPDEVPASDAGDSPEQQPKKRRVSLAATQDLALQVGGLHSLIQRSSGQRTCLSASVSSVGGAPGSAKVAFDHDGWAFAAGGDGAKFTVELVQNQPGDDYLAVKLSVGGAALRFSKFVGRTGTGFAVPYISLAPTTTPSWAVDREHDTVSAPRPRRSPAPALTPRRAAGSSACSRRRTTASRSARPACATAPRYSAALQQRVARYDGR